MSANLIILVAEDDENDVFLLSRALDRVGIRAAIQFVSDGQFAVDYLAGTGQYADRSRYPLPDLAFFDIKLPRKTGFEVLHWVRAQPQFQTLPVMIISASGEARDMKEAQRLGVNHYLVKPSDTDILAREIQRFTNFYGPRITSERLAENKRNLHAYI